MKERFEIFTLLIAKINRNIRRIKTEEMAEFNLKSPHVSCHYYLYKKGPLTAKELCDICDEDKASISRSLEYLEECEHVACEAAAGRRYKARYKLTEKGLEVGAKIAQKIDTILDRVGDGISEEERVILYRGLGIISDNLQKICDKYDG